LIILIILREEYKLWSSSLCSFLQPPVTSSLFSPNILFSTLFSNTTDKVAHPYRTTGKLVLYIPNFMFIESSNWNSSCVKNENIKAWLIKLSLLLDRSLLLQILRHYYC
jgi:hypothetical protein